MSKVKLIRGKYCQEPLGLVLVEKIDVAFCNNSLENAINNVNASLEEQAEKLDATHVFVDKYHVTSFENSFLVQAFGLVYKLSSGVYR